MRNYLTLLVLFCTSLTVFSQSSEHDHEGRAEKYCSTNEALEQLLEAHPEYAPLIEEAEQELESFTERFDPQEYERGSNYIIPVVFHIIHANGDENISVEQIEDAVEIMTEDFTLMNSDITGVVEAFENVVADVGIEFRLARLDPDGNCTNGIVRVESATTFAGGENLKSVSPAWPRDSYMNIWVAADLESGAAGYTFTPGSVDGFWGAANDGIVIQHSYVGSIGTGSPSRSRALTHEVGHWINLRHPWGPSNEPGLSSNCNSDDNVSDTPNTVGWTTCQLGGQTCGSLDNVQNFMEYSYCSRMFTQGQKNRMLAALNSGTADRDELHASSNLSSTGVLGPGELCKVEIMANADRICAGDSVVYTDLSYHNVTSRTWSFEGGTPATASGQTVVVYYNNPGTYNVTLQVSDGSTTISDSFNNQVKVWPSTGLPIEYTENFESNPSVEDEWTVVQNGNIYNWEIADNVSGASGNNALYLQNRSLDEGAVSEIISQPIDLSNTNTDVALSFKYAYARRNPGNSEKLLIWVSGNCGETWSLKDILSNDFETASFTNALWFPNSASQWETVTIDNISPGQLVSNFRFKFEFQSDGGNNIFIDDININGPNTTGFDEVDISSNLSVFPNPAHDVINLEIFDDRGYQFSVSLYNPLGQVVLQQDALNFAGGQGLFTFDTSHLSAGVYTLQVETEEGKRGVQRVMITR